MKKEFSRGCFLHCNKKIERNFNLYKREPKFKLIFASYFSFTTIEQKVRNRGCLKMPFSSFLYLTAKVRNCMRVFHNGQMFQKMYIMFCTSFEKVFRTKKEKINNIKKQRSFVNRINEKQRC